MVEQKAAVEVKQEGDFKIKSKPKRMKDLGSKSKNEIVKVDLSKPVTDEVKSNVIKVDLTEKPKTDAVQELKTETVDVDKQTGDGEKVDTGTRVTQEHGSAIQRQSPLQKLRRKLRSKK